MKNFYFLFALIILFAASCGKKETPIPQDEEVKAQQMRDAEARQSIASLEQGITVEIVKGNTELNGYITIYTDFPDYSKVDFSQLDQITPYLNTCKSVLVKPSYKKYGFELPTGKYLVFVYVDYPQTCEGGGLCSPPKYYTIREFEVKEGVKTTARIDFNAVDNVDNPGNMNYIRWE